jgi:hypothetical protein
MRLLLLLQLASTLPMCGLIWFVQVVHYPLFSGVATSGFSAYAAQHARRTSFVVGPFMLIELVTTLLLLFSNLRPLDVPPIGAWLGAGLLGVIWLSTALLQIPLHDRLQESFSLQHVHRLVASNWLRTGAWSLRSALVLWWVWQA